MKQNILFCLVLSIRKELKCPQKGTKYPRTEQIILTEQNITLPLFYS